MDKWSEYKTFERWKYMNEEELKRGYEEENRYKISGDTIRSFDDFCIGTWQSMS